MLTWRFSTRNRTNGASPRSSAVQGPAKRLVDCLPYCCTLLLGSRSHDIVIISPFSQQNGKRPRLCSTWQLRLFLPGRLKNREQERTFVRRPLVVHRHSSTLHCYLKGVLGWPCFRGSPCQKRLPGGLEVGSLSGVGSAHDKRTAVGVEPTWNRVTVETLYFVLRDRGVVQQVSNAVCACERVPVPSNRGRRSVELWHVYSPRRRIVRGVK